MKKTASINVMVDNETKKRLLDKSKSLGMSITAYIEKISREPIVFLDSNVRALLNALNFK